MAQKQIFSLLLVGCLAALALANPLPEEHPAVPAPTGPAVDPLYQNLAVKNARLEGKKDKRSAEEATTKTGGSLPTPVAPKVVPQNTEGKKEKLGTEERKADNVTREIEELVSLLANPFSPNLSGKKVTPNDTPKREAEEVKPKTEEVKTGSTQPIAPKPVSAPKKEKRENDSEGAELIKAELICDRESETSASALDDDPSTVDEVYDIADGCQEQLRELKGETPRVESHSDEPASTEEKKDKKSEDETDEPDCKEEDSKNKRSVEEETPRLTSKDVPTEKKEKRSTEEEKPTVGTKPAQTLQEKRNRRSAEEKPVVATKPAPKEEEHKEKRNAEEKPVVATKPAPKEEEHKEKRNAEEKPVVATKPAPKEEEHKDHKRSAEEKPVVATKPAPKEEEHKDHKRSAEEKPVVATKPAPKEEEHKDHKRSAEEKPVVATKPAPNEEEHKEKRSAEEEKPTVGTKEVKIPQEKRERRGVNEEKPVLAKDIPVPREEAKKNKRSTVETKATEGATFKDETKHSGPYPVPSTQEGSKKEKRYVDQVRAEKQTVPALKSQEPGELEKKVERRSAESTSVIKGAAFEDKPWEVKPYVTAPPAKLGAKE